MPCSQQGCSNEPWARGVCGTHYSYMRKKGTLPPTLRLTAPVDIFWSKVDESDGCWIWKGSLRGGGYARFKSAGKQIAAHRFAYELLVGPIPAGLHLDHLCRNRSCVRPDHLEPVTCGENIRRGLTGKWQKPGDNSTARSTQRGIGGLGSSEV